MKVGYIADKDGGVEYHRLIIPFNREAKLGHDVTRFNAIPLANVADVDVGCLVFSRFLGQEQAEVIAALQARGVRVICDVDDYWVLPSSHIVYKESKPFAALQIEAMELADEVWTTHEVLAQRVRHLNAHVTIHPNALDLTADQWQPSPMPDFPLRVGYVGGNSHVPDIEVTKGAWSKLNATAYLCGVDESNAKVYADMGRVMSSGWNKEIKLPTSMDVNDYGNHYTNFHIAIAPLADTNFNRHKSNLKILEAGAKCRPIMVQDMHPYTDKNDGIIPVRDWGNAFKRLNAMSLSEVTERGLSLRHYIEQHYDINQLPARLVGS